MKKITVAIVDDHEMLRDTLAELLETLGHTVLFSAGSDKQLLNRLKTATPLPDVCILDISLPDKTGYEVAKHLKRKWPGIKIIAFSVHEETTWKRLMLKAGVDFYLRKDAHPQLLHELIKYLVAH